MVRRVGFGFCVFLESCSAADDRPFVLPLLVAGVVELADSCMKLPELAPARLIIRPLRLSSCTHTKQICKLNLHFQQCRPFEVRCFVCTVRLMLTAWSS
jgi:hypothetical protein